jgi:ribosome production factor 1
MPKGKLSAKFALPYQSANKDRRKQFHIKQKKTRDAIQREERFARKKEEARDPRLREERLRKNVPKTIDSKRTWDDVGDGDEDGVLGLAVDFAQVAKRRKIEEEQRQQQLMDESDAGSEAEGQDEVPDMRGEEGESDVDSMLEDDDDDGDEEDDAERQNGAFKKPPLPNQERAASPNPSTTSTNLNLTPEALASKFPSLFAQPATEPKILITTSINSTLHDQARLLTELFPNSVYVRRSAHRFGHKFSVKEIASFATNRNYTTLIIMMEDQKKPCGLDFVHLPNGPMLHFSLTNWVEGKKLPGHGNPTNHYPEVSYPLQSCSRTGCLLTSTYSLF